MQSFWIVWSPQSDLPPRKRFASFNHASTVAASMAAKHKNSTFCVMRAEAESHYELSTNQVETDTPDRYTEVNEEERDE